MIDSNKINTVQRKIKEAIAQIEKDEEVKISFGTSRYTKADYKTTMTVKTTATDEKTVKAVDSVDELMSKRYGFSENIVGKSFTVNSGTYKVTGFKTRNRKYPIIAINADGKSYKFVPSQVKI